MLPYRILGLGLGLLLSTPFAALILRVYAGGCF